MGRTKLHLACAACVATLLAKGACAQDAGIDSVVVTGTKRTTSLQDSGLSVTVLNMEDIEQARLRDLRRLDDLVPNVQFNEQGQTSSVFVTIRGVESNPFIVNRAAIYIDGIPFRELSNAVLNQIQSIEVLRGPQGSLYGANSESGLLLITTRIPEEEGSAETRVTTTRYSSGHGVVVDGFVTGSLLPQQLAGSIAFMASDEDSFIKNLGSAINEPGEIRENFLQGRLRWTPTDAITVNATAYVLNKTVPGLFKQEFLPLDYRLYDKTYGAYNGGRPTSKFTYFNDAPKHTDEEEIVSGLSANYQLPYGELDLAASYRVEDFDTRGLDFDFTALPTAGGREAERETVSSAELRFSSPAANAFNYIVGVSTYKEEVGNTKATYIGAATSLDAFVAAPENVSGGRDSSVFGSISYTPAAMPRWNVSGGVRYERARREARQYYGVLDLGLSGSIVYPEADLADTFDATLPRVTLRYEPNDRLTLHMSSSRGYIPGGFNLAAMQEGVVSNNVLVYQPETLTSYEAGAKWLSDDARLRMAAAVFSIESNNWQEIQLLSDEQGRPISSDFIGSAASISSRGAEFELSFDMTDGLKLDVNVGYVNAEYRRLLGRGDVDLAGNVVKLVPEYDAYAALRYEWGAGWYVRAETGFTGAMALDERNRAVQKATVQYGVQAGYEGERFSVRLFGENLSNVRRASGIGLENLAFGTDSNFYSPLEAPRVAGLELELRL